MSINLLLAGHAGGIGKDVYFSEFLNCLLDKFRYGVGRSNIQFHRQARDAESFYLTLDLVEGLRVEQICDLAAYRFSGFPGQ